MLQILLFFGNGKDNVRVNCMIARDARGAPGNETETAALAPLHDVARTWLEKGRT